MDNLNNPKPVKEMQLVKGGYYHWITRDSRRGGPGGSYDRYNVELLKCCGLKVQAGRTHVIIDPGNEEIKERLIPIERIFLSDEDARNCLPEDRNY